MFPSRSIDFPGRRSATVLFSCALLIATSSLRGDFQFAETLFPQLAELIRLAAENGRESQLNELRIEERLGDMDVAAGQRRPQVRSHARMAGAYETRSDISDRFRGNLYANVTVQQPLYHWGSLERYQAVAEGRLTLEQVEAMHRSERHFMQIRTYYLQWLLMKERQAIVEQSISLAESFVEARRQLVEVGQSSEQDVLEMEARLLESHESILFIDKSITSLEQRLRYLVGQELPRAALPGDSLRKIMPINGGEFDELARQVRRMTGELLAPEVERFSLLSDIEADYMSILEKENHPKLDFVAGVFSDHIDGINNEDFILRIQYYAGVQVNWSIFDGWQKQGRLRSTLARKRSYEIQEQAARESHRQRSEDLLAELELNLKQIEARRKRADILQRRLELVREQVERDLLPGSERIELEINYLEVRQRLEEARVNYLINFMELGVLTGHDPARLYYENEQ